MTDTVPMVPMVLNGRYPLLLPEHRAAREEWKTGWEEIRIESMHDHLKPGDLIFDIGSEESRVLSHRPATMKARRCVRSPGRGQSCTRGTDMTERTCSVEGCERMDRLIRGWCKMHYGRWQTHGDPLRTDKPYGDPVASFWLKVVPGPGCWEWNGATSTTGYGQLRIARRLVRAHRWAYEHFVGPIPEGFDVDHTCHNADPLCAGGFTCSHRRCTRPNHLEAVSHRENVLRSRVSIPAVNARKTECREGHPYATKVTGARHCPICRQNARLSAKRQTL